MYPSTWPDGTLKTLHTPFNWRFEINVPADHLKTSQRASDPLECTTAFNQWRSLIEGAAKKNVPTWPEYRDAYNAREALPPESRTGCASAAAPSFAHIERQGWQRGAGQGEAGQVDRKDQSRKE